MTQRLPPETMVKMTRFPWYLEPNGGSEILSLEYLYSRCSWRETGDDLDLEAALIATGRRVEDGWRIIELYVPSQAGEAE